MKKIYERNTLKVYGDDLSTGDKIVLEDVNGNKVEIEVFDILSFITTRESYIKYVLLKESPEN